MWNQGSEVKLCPELRCSKAGWQPKISGTLPLIRKWGWPPQGRRWIIFVPVDLLSASCRFPILVIPILVIIEIAPQHLWSSVSGFFHFARCFQGSSMSQHVSVLHSFSLPNIPLYGYTTFVYSCIIWWTFGVVCSLGDCEQCCEYFGVQVFAWASLGSVTL